MCEAFWCGAHLLNLVIRDATATAPVRAFVAALNALVVFLRSADGRSAVKMAQRKLTTEAIESHPFLDEEPDSLDEEVLFTGDRYAVLRRFGMEFGAMRDEFAGTEVPLNMSFAAGLSV